MRRLVTQAELAGENFAAVVFLSLVGLDLSLWLLSKGVLIGVATSPLLM